VKGKRGKGWAEDRTKRVVKTVRSRIGKQTKSHRRRKSCGEKDFREKPIKGESINGNLRKRQLSNQYTCHQEPGKKGGSA